MLEIIKNRIRNFLKINKIERDSDEIKTALGKILSNLNKSKKPKNIEEIEFKIFSQFGDDGIIQFLINNLQIENDHKKFIEFGVENYLESNTRFLLFNNNWSGLIIDSSQHNINQIKRSNYFWKFDLEAKCAFITRDNINELISNSKVNNKVGLLSIDIDGNDYWVWEKINTIDPLIVIVEYNSNFGFKEKITIPYNEKFVRGKAHYSNLYWGTSLEALKYLAEKKGYKFICTNSSGNNAYFIKSSKFNDIELKLEKNFHESKFRESRNKSGDKNFLYGSQKIKEISECKVICVETNEEKKLKDFLNK
tara:strand:- start:24 stop:947 length:924 start_codon:yes stop_codon:yes gene_type:complete